ncbi:MAG: aminopeptidase P family protein [Thermodesulfobacteriota bacterium]
MTLEQQKRIIALRQALRSKRLDALLITRPENRRYLSGFTAHDGQLTESSGALLISRDQLILLTDSRYELQAGEEATGYKVIVPKHGLPRTLGGLARRYGIYKLGFESHYLLVSVYERLGRLPALKLISTRGIIEKIRAQKTEEELKNIEDSIRLNEAVFSEINRILRPGMTEREIAFEIERLTRSMGAEDVSFEPIVASGPNAAKPHATPTDRPIREGESIIIDMGARLNGYCSDMTRTLWLGKTGAKFKKIYRTVRKAQVAAIASLKTGLKARDADKIARDIISKAGYGQAFGHSLGHGVGLAVHEGPTLSPRSKDTLKAGMVVTVEPGIYIPGWGGVRLENMVVIEDHGCRVLNNDETFYDFPS